MGVIKELWERIMQSPEYIECPTHSDEWLQLRNRLSGISYAPFAPMGDDAAGVRRMVLRVNEWEEWEILSIEELWRIYAPTYIGEWVESVHIDELKSEQLVQLKQLEVFTIISVDKESEVGELNFPQIYPPINIPSKSVIIYTNQGTTESQAMVSGYSTKIVYVVDRTWFEC